MTLYQLKPIGEIRWGPRKAAEVVVVRAESIGEARKVAQDAMPTPHRSKDRGRRDLDELAGSPWLDGALTTCEKIASDGPTKVFAIQWIG